MRRQPRTAMAASTAQVRSKVIVMRCRFGDLMSVTGVPDGYTLG
jgi:hypothetical protein